MLPRSATRASQDLRGGDASAHLARGQAGHSILARQNDSFESKSEALAWILSNQPNKSGMASLSAWRNIGSSPSITANDGLGVAWIG